MKVYHSNSTEDTQNFAAKLAKSYKSKGGIIALSGDLGAGKTTFTQGFAKGLNIKDKIISPTFVLVRIHQIPKSKSNLYHIDLYRLEGKVKLEELGMIDFIGDKNIVLIEWAEKISNPLPIDTSYITFKKTSESTREIIVSSK